MALGGGNLLSAVDRDFDGGVRQARLILVLFDDHAKRFEVEGRRELVGELLHQDFQRAVGDIELVAFLFEVLDLGNDLAAVVAVGA